MFVAISVLDAWSLSVLADDEPTKPDPDNPKVVERGKAVYAEQCASCHGANLEGQPDWRHRLPSGRVPAPPHDPSGHTWHHSDKQLFDMTKFGPGALVPGYESDMPGFKDIAQRRRNLGRALIHREHVADRYPCKAAAHGRPLKVLIVHVRQSNGGVVIQ